LGKEISTDHVEGVKLTTLFYKMVKPSQAKYKGCPKAIMSYKNFHEDLIPFSKSFIRDPKWLTSRFKIPTLGA